MKNKILYRVYLVRLLPLLILFGIMMIMLTMDEIVFHMNYETAFFMVLLALSGAVSMYMMRSAKDYDFINSLPVTKKQQWNCMYMAILTVIFIVYALYILVIGLRYRNEINTMPEIVLSGVVKAIGAVLVMTFLLWLFSHTDFHFPNIPLIVFALIVFGLPAIGSLIQKAFNTGDNNFFYILINYWIVMTVPKKAVVYMCEENFANRCIALLDDKATITIIYLLAAIVFSVILALLARKNYAKMDLSKNPMKGYIKAFAPAVVAISVFLCTFGLYSRVIQVVDKGRLEVYFLHDPVTERVFDWEEYDRLDTKIIVANKEGDQYYTGLEAAHDEYNYFMLYEIYIVDFPKDYLYIFIGGVALSICTGTGAAVLVKKYREEKKENGIA